MKKLEEVVIVSAVRTPIGSFGGSLSALSATQLGAAAIKGAVEKAGVAIENIEEVIMGNVVSAGLGQAPARQAALAAGLGYEVRCTTVNKVCASGTKAIMYAAQSIMTGQASVVVAGGMESMTNAPFYVPKARFGYKFGKGEFLDGLEYDGLMDAYDQCAMGVFADHTARKYGVSRKAQDDYAIASYQKAAEAAQAGYLANEIIPITLKDKRLGEVIISEDEEYKKVNFEKIPTLRPAFTRDGTATAASSSSINDGASALVMMSKSKAQKLGLEPIAQILGFADSEHEPKWFTTAPATAVPAALKVAGVSKHEIDFYEINEAFAVVPLVFEKMVGVHPGKINAFGGSVALGHPLGASGARIVTTLINVLHTKGGNIGAVGICNGGGGASAMVIERL
jgi:acetyl-CoA C-acetyltransferase